MRNMTILFASLEATKTHARGWMTQLSVNIVPELDKQEWASMMDELYNLDNDTSDMGSPAPGATCTNTDGSGLLNDWDEQNDWDEDCEVYEMNPSWCGDGENAALFISNDACCACGGGYRGPEIIPEIAPEVNSCEANEHKEGTPGTDCSAFWSRPHLCGDEDYYTEDFDSMRDCCACQQ